MTQSYSDLAHVFALNKMISEKKSYLTRALISFFPEEADHNK